MPDAAGRAPAWAWAGLAVVIAVYLALATAQSYATRLQWGPDEPAHIIYVRSLATGLGLPALTHGEQENAYLPGGARTYQAQHPPLYYALAAVVWRAFAGRPDDVVSYRDEVTGEARTFTVPGAVRPVRFLSIVLGAMTLLCVWAAARTAFPARAELWVAAAGLVGFAPMFTYDSGVVNNDSLLALVFTAIGWHWAKLLRSGAGTRQAAAAGLLLGIALNVKETALALVVVSAIVLAVAPGTSSRSRRIANILLALGVAATLGGWWFLRKWLIYGTPFVYPFNTPLLGLPPEQRWPLALALPKQVFMFSFIPLDVVQRHLGVWALSRFFGGLMLLSAGGIALLICRRRRLPVPRAEAAAIAAWVSAGALVLVGVFRFAILIDWRMGTSGGRYMVAALPLLGPVAARGLSALFGDGKWSKVALLIILVALAAVNALVIRATAAEYGTL
ncbi:MAG: ArnT family glycosyltransferase [Armatimonadota bacterium]